MSMKLPEKLGKSPLIEVAFEIQFESTMPSAGDLLIGLLYSKMKSEYPDVKALPLAGVPREIKAQTPELRYKTSHRLAGKFNFVSIGDQVVSLSTVKYPGWTKFKGMAQSLVAEVESTGLIKRIERFSIRYINVIDIKEKSNELSLLNTRIELGGGAFSERGFQLRVERDIGRFTVITQLAAGTTAKNSITGKEVTGLLVDVDTVSVNLGGEFTQDRESVLEEAHSIAKQTFYNLLTEATIQRLEPQG